MLYVTFITVGDLPRGPYQEIADKLKKPLQQFVKLEHRIVKDEDAILKQIPEGDLVIVLDERGKQFTSAYLAQFAQRVENEGRHLTVILGGPKGLPLEVKKKAHVMLALSAMTTTHDLAHIFFLEQLYRIMTIAHGKTYHY